MIFAAREAVLVDALATVREATALDRLTALRPAAVVAGHKDPTRGNPPSILDESRGYLEHYGELREAALSDQDVFDAVVSRYPDWVSRQQFPLVG